MAKAPGGTAPLQVVLPKKLVSALRSRQRPTDATKAGEELRSNPLYDALNNTVRNYRGETNLVSLLREVARIEGPIGTAVHNIVETAQTKYIVAAYDADTHIFSAEATSLALSNIARFDTPFDYTKFEQKRSFDGTIELMLRESVLSGAVACELVLNDAYLPERIQVVGAETLKWFADGKGGQYPGQTITGKNEPVYLNIPSFFVDRVHPDPGMFVARSMLESALKMLLYFEEFREDIRRVVRSSGHNRTTITLDYQKIYATASKEIQKDPAKLQIYMADVKAAVEESLANTNPEDALVMFDSAKADVLQSGTGVKQDYLPLLEVAVGQYATSMKTPPSALGLRLQGGSSNTGSVETMVFLKSVKATHKPVETTLSRVLTLANRLAGSNSYVWFQFDPIDLRPENELHAFRTMRQTQLNEQLSMGLISDDEHANLLGRFPRPAGAPNLSGTFFLQKSNNTAQAEDQIHPGDTPAGRTLQPAKDVPRKGGGKSQ